MSQRDRDLLWLRDLLDQLRARHQELEWSEDGRTVAVLTESMIRDLDRCRRLCEDLQGRCVVRTAVQTPFPC